MTKGCPDHIVSDMRLVLDTNVLITAVRNPAGASAELLRLGRMKRVVLVTSVPLFLEYETVMTRPEHLAQSGLDLSQIDILLNGLAAIMEKVELHFLWRPLLRDPDDEMVLETAINGRADALVTFNIKHFAAAAHQFGLRVVPPADILTDPMGRL